MVSRQQWEENKDRPAWIREHSGEIESQADLDGSIPSSLVDIPEWAYDNDEEVGSSLPGADELVDATNDDSETEDDKEDNKE